MPLRLLMGRREFAPSWLMTVATVLLCMLFVGLGRWQWQRSIDKQAQQDGFARGGDAPLELGARALISIERHRRVILRGEYLGERQFLLDNRTYEGKAGYEVLTPFRLGDGRILLVNRGWVPFSGFRDRLPDVTLQSAGATMITGRIDMLPSGGLARGHAAPDAASAWPRVTSYPAMAELSSSLGVRLQERLLLLDAQLPQGYVRDWQPPGLGPQRHLSYAIQWWSFAALLLALYFVLNIRKSSS
jgi:surfeit locus 1 family protein